MEALRFAIDLVAANGDISLLRITGKATGKTGRDKSAESGEEKKSPEDYGSCKEYLEEQFADSVDKQVSANEEMKKGGYGGDWTLEISSMKGAYFCGSTEEGCMDEDIATTIKRWCGGSLPEKLVLNKYSECNENGEEWKIAQCPAEIDEDGEWYHVKFDAKLRQGISSQEQNRNSQALPSPLIQP